MRNKLLDFINEIRIDKELKTVENIKDSDDLFNDLSLESLDLAQLTVMLEEHFDIDVFEDNIVTTVGEILIKLQKDE